MSEKKITLDGYVFWQGNVRLNAGQLSHDVNCRIFLDATPDKDLRIEIANELGFAALGLINEENLSVNIPGVSDPVGLLMSNVKINSDRHNVLTLGVRRSPIWRAQSQQIITGRAMLVNFANYGLGNPQHLSFQLIGAGWKAQFHPISDETLVVPDSMQSDEYRITHQVEFGRENGALFTPVEAEHFLEDLHYFLSFCRGRWVAAAFTVATDRNGNIGMEQWGTGKVSPWRNPSSWLDNHHGEPIVELFEPFCKKLTNPAWRDALSHASTGFSAPRPTPPERMARVSCSRHL